MSSGSVKNVSKLNGKSRFGKICEFQFGKKAFLSQIRKVELIRFVSPSSAKKAFLSQMEKVDLIRFVSSSSAKKYSNK